MKELTLADCYGYAGLSGEATNISLRLEPVQKVAKDLTPDQVVDLVRFYFGLPVSNETDWFSAPIIEADPAFSMVTNKREVSIIAMALLAQEIHTEESQHAALAVLVAHACGKRTPAVYPQFVEMVLAAAKDLSISHRRPNVSKQIKVRALSKDLGASEEDLVPGNDFATLNRVLKEINADSQEMDRFLANQISGALAPIRSELANLREEKDMLWWLIGGQSSQLDETYSTMTEGRAAYLIGAELAALCSTQLGPRASGFLLNKALREGRSDKMATVKIDALPKFFTESEIGVISNTSTIDQVRDLCFLNNALARANDIGLPTAWRKKYAEDNSLADKTAFEPTELALQSFREALLLKSLTT